MSFLRLQPLDRRADRARRLVYLVLAGLALLLLALWNPVTTPGPIVCTLRRACAIPCPFCGVTRGVALCLRGRPVEASAYNPLTVPIVVIGVGLMVVWAIEYVRNVRFSLTLKRPWPRLLVGLAFLALLAGWVYMLTFRREDNFADSWLAGALRLFW